MPCSGSFLLGHGTGHSIARPIAFGNRVPPQRTVLGETPVARLGKRLLLKGDKCAILTIEIHRFSGEK